MASQRDRLVGQFTQRTLGKTKPTASINAPAPAVARQRRPFRSAEVAAANPHATGALAGWKRTDFTKTGPQGDVYRYHAYVDPKTGKRKAFRVGGPTNRKLT